MRVAIFCFGLASWGIPIPLAFGQADDLVTFARVRNKAAIDSITSMECRYERILVAPTTLEEAKAPCFYMPAAPGRFWRSGNTFRLIDPIDDGTTREYVARDGKLLVWRGGGPLQKPTLTLYTIQPVFGVGGEMWRYLLFSHWDGGPSSAFYLFYDIATHPSCVVHVAERTPHPRKDIHIDLSRGEVRFECWFDAKTNYLIHKLIATPSRHPDGGQYHYEEEVIEFREAAPAIYVPVIIEHRCYKNKSLRSTIRTIISDLKVNHSLAETDLQIPRIAGMKCIDADRVVEYMVDARGERVGPESPTKLVKIAPEPTEKGRKVWAPPKPSSPPLAWWAWCLIASVAILLVGGVLAAVRRVKSRRE